MDRSRSNIPEKMDSSSVTIRIDPRPPSDQRLNVAIQNGNSVRVQEIFEQDPAAKTDAITERLDTPLMVAISSVQSIEFLTKLLGLLGKESLDQQNNRGNTALHEATIVGYVQAAELLMEKSPYLSKIRNKESYLAIHTAAAYGHGELVTKSLDPYNFLDSESPDASIEDTEVPTDQKRWEWGVMLLHLTISSRMLDKALLVAKGLLKVGIDRDLTWRGVSPLELMAQDPYAFSSIIKDWNILRRFIYENVLILHSSDKKKKPHWMSQVMKFILIGVPWVKKIHQMKLMHSDASDLVEKVFLHYRRNSETYPINTLMSAVKNGIDEIAVLILDNYPTAVEWKADERLKRATNEVEEEEEGCSALHFAVMYRRENIFTTIFHKIGERKELLWAVDKLNNNNILHLVGQMPHQPQLKFVSGAVLQMQRELQWYKKVEEVLPVEARAATNREGMRPIKVFYKEHRNMIQDEKKWFLSMAGACLISTSLIGTIAFTAAIQVPGGISSADGRAQLQNKTAFTIFSVANAVALYSAISTFLIFLSIYSSRTAAIDFLYSMPRKLIFGLIFLFVSVISTIVAFDSALVILLSGEPHFTVYCVLGIILSFFVIFIAVIQLLPTLANMIKTTCGSRSMFIPVDKKMPSMFSPVDKKRGRIGKRFGEF